MEFACYLILAGLGAAGILRQTVLFKTLLLLYMAGFLWFANPDITGKVNHWIQYPAFFAAGALIALYKGWFQRHGGRLLLCTAPVLVAIYFLTPYTGTARFFLIPPLSSIWGACPPRKTGSAGSEIPPTASISMDIRLHNRSKPCGQA